MTDAAAAVIAGPSPDEIAKSPLLRNWSFTILWNGSLALAGMVQDSPDFADNDAIVTSPLGHLDTARGIARTRSRWYRLGRPHFAGTEGTTLLVGHHGPSRATAAGGIDSLTSAFHSDLDDLILKTHPDYWLFGQSQIL